MRRVDEAMRAVLSDAISKDLQDPRVGFVTVTGVKTSPDLRHARVFVSVLGDDATRGRRASTDCSRPTAFSRVASRSALRLKHTPTLTFGYDDSVDRGMRISQLIEAARTSEPMSSVGEPSGVEAGRAAVLDELRTAAGRSCVTHEHPDGDALGLADRNAAACSPRSATTA